MKNTVIIILGVLVVILFLRHRGMALNLMPQNAGGKVTPGVQAPPSTTPGTVDLATPVGNSGSGGVVVVNSSDVNNLIDAPYDPVLSGSLSV